MKKVKVKSLNCVQLFVTPQTVAYEAPPSMGFSRQEYWSGLPFPSTGDLPDPGIEPGSPALQADALPSKPPGKPELIHAAAAAKLFQSCLTLCDPIDGSPPGSTIPGILQARTLVGCHFLLQGIFPTQGLNPGLLHCRQMLYPLSHQGRPHTKYLGFPLILAKFLMQNPSVV